MNYDIIVIGSGPGGYVAAIRAAQLGMKTAVVEKAEVGGVCLNWGCIPTKALLKSAQVYKNIKDSASYGIEVENYRVDFGKVVARSRRVAEQMSKGVQYLFKKNNIDLIKGFGKIKTKNTVEITDNNGEKKQYSASHIIIATGARSRELPNLKQDGKKVIGYKQALTLDKLPETMLVVGSGAIGTELAFFYASMGTQVTIVEFMPRIIPLEDEEVSAALARSLKKNKIKILTDSTVEKVEITQENKCRVFIKTKKGEETKDVDVVLSSVGVTTNLAGIGLEDVGVKIEKNKVVVDNYYRTNIEGIYAIGDIVNGPALAHVASAEAIVCVENIAGLNPKPIDYNNIPSCIYTTPEVSSVGLTEQQAVDSGYDVRIGKFPYTASGKATAAGIRDGFVKLVFDKKTDTLLGAHIVGYNVTEMIAELVVAKRLDAKAVDFIKSVHPHPTMSEAIMEAAAQAHDEVIHL